MRPNFNIFSFFSDERNCNPFHLSYETELYFINNKDILLSLDFSNKKPIKKHLDNLSADMIELISHKKNSCKLKKNLLTFIELKQESIFKNKGIIESNEIFHGKPKAFNESFNNNWMNGFTILALKNSDIRTILGITEEKMFNIIVTGSKGGCKQGIYPPDISILKRKEKELHLIAKLYVKNLKTCKHSEDLLRELLKSFGWSLIENKSIKYNEAGNVISKAFNVFFIPAENPTEKNRLIFGMWVDGIPPELKRFSDIFDQVVNLATGNDNHEKWRYSKLSRIVNVSELQDRITDRILLGSKFGLRIVDSPTPWSSLTDEYYISQLISKVNRTISLREMILYSLKQIAKYYLALKSQNLANYQLGRLES